MSRPPVTYPVSLADLIDIADAACDLDGMKCFYVDQPAVVDQIKARVDRLHSIVERAAGFDQALIYGAPEGVEAAA